MEQIWNITKRWTSIHMVLLEPIGSDRQDSVRFSIAETELTIPESALGDGHRGGASASTPLQLWDSRFVNRCEGTSFVDASDRATCRVHYFHGPRSKRVEGLDTSWIHRVFLGRHWT